ncbi:MAG TPA: OmpH family outer membrane protein, partial [Nitrospiraceae bacterium]|nr:OmpH family outer membrane protein [Nitrospiraceae bacterium]
MNRGNLLVSAWVAMAILGQGTVGLAAEFKVGVIDQQTIMQKTKAGKRALEDMKQFSGSRQKIIATDDEALKELEKSMKAQESGLSESAKRE